MASRFATAGVGARQGKEQRDECVQCCIFVTGMLDFRRHGSVSNVIQRIGSMMKTFGEQNSPEAESTIGAHRAIQVVFMWNLFGDDLLYFGLRAVLATTEG